MRLKTGAYLFGLANLPAAKTYMIAMHMCIAIGYRCGQSQSRKVKIIRRMQMQCRTPESAEVSPSLHDWR